MTYAEKLISKKISFRTECGRADHKTLQKLAFKHGIYWVDGQKTIYTADDQCIAFSMALGKYCIFTPVGISSVTNTIDIDKLLKEDWVDNMLAQFEKETTALLER